jgi:hypothetical protein
MEYVAATENSAKIFRRGAQPYKRLKSVGSVPRSNFSGVRKKNSQKQFSFIANPFQAKHTILSGKQKHE